MSYRPQGYTGWRTGTTTQCQSRLYSQSGTKHLATDEAMSGGMGGGVRGVDGVPGKNEQETTEQDGNLSTLE
jgi:hypothetical protein